MGKFDPAEWMKENGDGHDEKAAAVMLQLSRNDRFTYRSTEGLAKTTGLGSQRVSNILSKLVASGVVEVAKSQKFGCVFQLVE